MAAKKDAKLSAASPVTALTGISEARGAAFAKLGVGTLGELCRFYPRTYENRGHPCTVADAGRFAGSGEPVAMVLTVGAQPQITTIRRGMTLVRFPAFDETGTCTVTYFNQTFLKSTFQTGLSFRFFGRVTKSGGRLSLNAPKHEPLPLGDPGDGSLLPALYPVYRLSEGLTQKLVSDAAAKALAAVYPAGSEIPDPLPDAVRDRYALCSFGYAIHNIHAPENEAALDAARKRLIFEELLLFSLGLRLRKAARLSRLAPPMEPVDMTPFLSAQPYALTGAQTRAINDFLRDMTDGHAPMNRLLSGDVGSGKTVCAAAALYIAVKNGYQAALMAPTEILAHQHYEDLAPMFAKFGVSVELLVGSTKPKEKARIKASLADGTLPLIIGTHALLEADVVMPRCGLVVTDEQHRFGVGQRAVLSRKAEHVHVLIMSATPIPRTLALMLFGDLDMSVLDEMPPGRQKVSTFAVDETYRERLNGFIRKQVTEGHQVYIVCPAVDEAEDDDAEAFLPERPTMKAAVAFARELSETVFPDLSVGFLHGKMKGAEKDAVMADFASGKTQILVSTTVIEVGVNVPNATLMVVENAEFFGLSQLHQLRGRVGRGNAKSWCILVSENKGETARARLEILCKSNNGYEIAQKDLELRGPGDFFASAGQTDPAGSGFDVRQSGGLRFEIVSFCDDMAMIEDAFSAAGRIAEDDPALEKPEHALLKQNLSAHFSDIIA